MWLRAVLLVILICVAVVFVRAAAQTTTLRMFFGGGGAATPAKTLFPLRRSCLPPAADMFAALVAGRPRVLKRSSRAPVMVRTHPADYNRTDALSDHFTEDVRIDCRFGALPSPRETHATMPQVAGEDHCVTRERVYTSGRECNAFNPTFAKWVVESAVGRGARVLDPSAGWGDRLLGALAAGAKRYQGYDPNPRLAAKYREIVDAFGSGDHDRYQVATAPFEDGPPTEACREFDIAFTSPPYYALEEYVTPEMPGRKAQSIVRWPAFDDWVQQMYLPYIRRMYSAVRPGGWVVLYVENVRVDGTLRPLRQIAAAELQKLGVAKNRRRYGLRVDTAGKQGKVRWALAWQKPKHVRFTRKK